MENYRFKVNLGGMIEILSDHLYSSPDVYIRELLQNGVDAITARKQIDKDFNDEKIKINLEPGKALTFYDNGSGLTKDEIHKFLAIIGESSKKDIQSGKILEEYIGRFGIGLLSYFMVTDEIVVETKSVKEGVSMRWIGKPDGTYTLDEMETECEVGTTIKLACKVGKEEYFQTEKVKDLIMYYGTLLPFPILFSDGEENVRMNQAYLPWEKEDINMEEVMMFGETLLGEQFMDCIPIKSEEGMVSGVAYILPYTVYNSKMNNHRVYLKNMLLTEKGDSILPDWAVFVRCIINAKNLRPTASREGFYEDEVLEKAREEIGKCISDYMMDIAENDVEFMKAFLNVHQRVLKAMAIENDELFKIFFRYFEFVSTNGIITGEDLLNEEEPVVYTDNTDEYKQMSQIFFAQSKLLLNTTYAYDIELISKSKKIFDIEYVKLESQDIEDIMEDLSVDEYEQCYQLNKVANKILRQYDCKVEIKKFSPETMPSFYFLDKKALYFRAFEKAKESADPLFMGMLSAFANDFKETAVCCLYLNYGNPVVRKLSKLKEPKEIERFVEILYSQSLLIGGYTMQNNELSILNKRIMEVISDYIE